MLVDTFVFIVPLTWCHEKGTLPLWSSSPKYTLPVKSWEKSHMNPISRDIPQNNCSIFLKTVKVIKNKWIMRNCPRQEDIKEIWWLNIMSFFYIFTTLCTIGYSIFASISINGFSTHCCSFPKIYSLGLQSNNSFNFIGF